MPLNLRPKPDCRWDLVSLGEVMLRFDPGDRRVWTTRSFEVSEGGGSVSECFLAASRMKPGDKESWHREWKRVADFNHKRGDEELAKGHVQTAKNCWLRASEYYRQAEFWLTPDDPRRLNLQPYGAEDEPTSASPPMRGNPFALAVNTLVDCARVRDFWHVGYLLAHCQIVPADG